MIHLLYFISRIVSIMDGHQPLKRTGHFLSAFLCQIDLSPKVNEDQTMKEPFLGHPAVKSYLSAHSRDESVRQNYFEVARSSSRDSFETLINDLQLSNDCQTLLGGPACQFVLKDEGPSFLLLRSSEPDKKMINQVVKLPDILANAFQGELPPGFEVERLVDQIVFNLLICHYVHQVAKESNLRLPVDSLASRYQSNY